jgi:hypothetical protein
MWRKIAQGKKEKGIEVEWRVSLDYGFKGQAKSKRPFISVIIGEDFSQFLGFGNSIEF